MRKYLFLLFLLIATNAHAGGQQTLVTPDGNVFGTPTNPLQVTVVGGGGASISDDAYGAGWNGDTTAGASKNALYDKIETTVIDKGLFNGNLSYEGFLSNRGLLPNTTSVSYFQMNTRSPYWSRVAMRTFRIIVPNFWVNASFVEAGLGAATTIEASIEYPAGTFTRVKFSGSDQGTIPDNSYLISDDITVTIPKDTRFWVRFYWENPNGIIYAQSVDISGQGGGFEVATTGLTNKVVSGSLTSSDSHLPVMAIIGQTTSPSVIILGDSKTYGTGDSTGDSTVDFGNIARSIGGSLPYANIARGGERANHFNPSSGWTNRLSLLQYATHAIVGYGYNDAAASQTAVQIEASLTTIWDYLVERGIRVYQITMEPGSTSTDSWATTANQTVRSWSDEMTAVNVWIRTNPGKLSGYFEVCNAISSGADSEKWQVDGTPNKYTADGVHPSTAGYLLIKTSGAIPPNFPFVGKYSISDFKGFRAVSASVQTIAAGNTVTADSCGSIKSISSAGAVTTDTTNTFTAPSADNKDCCMDVVNVGANNITLDNNANFVSFGAADVVLTANDSVRVCEYNGASGKWYQTGLLVAN